MMRESSRAGSGAGGYISGALTATLVRYVRVLAGETGVELLVTGARDPRKVRVLEDPTCWSSRKYTNDGRFCCPVPPVSVERDSSPKDLLQERGISPCDTSQRLSLLQLYR